MEDLKGKICLVTGATSGMGEAAAHALAQRNATVILVARDMGRAWKTIGRIKSQTGNSSIEAMIYDLSSQAEIRELVTDFKSKYQRLDVLVNNAGAWFNKRQLSADGIEMTFALNHLGPYLLTNLLLDSLKTAAPSRIVNVSSYGHAKIKGMNFDDLQFQKNYGNGMRAYRQSKLANILFTYELARRLSGTGVTVNAANPGLVATNFGMNNVPWLKGWMRNIWKDIFGMFALSPDSGAQTAILLASAAGVEKVTGKYFTKEMPEKSSPGSYDEAAASRLWEISVRMTGLKLD